VSFFRSLVTDLLGGAVPLQKATVTLTNAQIKALPTTPITLIAAPGSGYIIKLLAATVVVNTTAGAYTNIDTTYCAVPQFSHVSGGLWLATPAAINDDSLTTDMTYATTVLGSTAKRVLHCVVPVQVAADQGSTSGAEGIVFSNVTNAASDFENLPVLLDAYNGSGDFTGGNAANTMRVTAYYTVEAI
jgi:hypothetical protein